MDWDSKAIASTEMPRMKCKEQDWQRVKDGDGRKNEVGNLKLELKMELEPGAKGKGFVWSGKSFDSHGLDNPSRNRNKVLCKILG